MSDQDIAVIELAAAQAADNNHPFETRITWSQGEDGLPHASSVVSIKKEGR